MQISINANIPTLRLGDINKALLLFVQKEMKIAIKEFFKKTLPRIPIRTGFARGSFTAAANEFGVRNSVSGYGFQEYYRFGAIKVLKTATSGQQFVTDPKEVLLTKGTRVEFNLKTAIDYFRINDYYRNAKVSSTPWQSFDTGLMVMINYLETMGRRFPGFEGIYLNVKVELKPGQQRPTVTRSRNFNLKPYTGTGID